MKKRDSWWQILSALSGTGFFLWVGLFIMICDTETRKVDWLGVGGRTGWRLSCALESGAMALAGVLLLAVLSRLTEGIVIDRRTERWINAGLLILGVAGLLYLGAGWMRDHE
jgi:hypothetical protein